VTYALGGDPNRIPHVLSQLSLLSPQVVIAIGSLAALALTTHPVDTP
jgi:uracil-DNA glycosylase